MTDQTSARRQERDDAWPRAARVFTQITLIGSLNLNGFTAHGREFDAEAGDWKFTYFDEQRILEVSRTVQFRSSVELKIRGISELSLVDCIILATYLRKNGQADVMSDINIVRLFTDEREGSPDKPQDDALRALLKLADTHIHDILAEATGSRVRPHEFGECRSAICPLHPVESFIKLIGDTM